MNEEVKKYMAVSIGPKPVLNKSIREVRKYHLKVVEIKDLSIMELRALGLPIEWGLEYDPKGIIVECTERAWQNYLRRGEPLKLF